MPVPTFSLTTFGSSPVKTSKARLEDGINTVLSQLWSDVLAGSGKFFRSRADAVAFGQRELPPGVNVVTTLESGVITWRVPFQSSDDPLFATSPYWGVVSRQDVASAMRDAGVISLVSVGGTGDEITASLPAAATRNGVTATSGSSIVELIPIATNSGLVEPFLVINGGAPATIKNATGNAVVAGQLVAGRSYFLRRRGSVWRIIFGDVAYEDMYSRVWHTTNSNLTTVTPPTSVNQISIATNNGHITYFRLSGPPATVDPTIHAQTADGRWWRLSENTADIRALISALTAGRVFSLVENTLTPAGETIPSNVNTLIIRRNNGGREWTMWRIAQTAEIPSDRVSTATVALDALGKWWFLIFDSRAVSTTNQLYVHVRNTLSPSAEPIPTTATSLLVRKNNGPDAAWWRPATGIETPVDGIETATTVKDANDKWWTVIFNTQDTGWPLITSRANAIVALPRLAILGCTTIMVLEGTSLVVRAATATEDPLFPSAPQWGVVWSSTANSGGSSGASLYLPGRPDYEREHLPEYMDINVDQLKDVSAGFGVSLSYMQTFIDFTDGWFLAAQARTSEQQVCNITTIPGYEPLGHVIHPCIMEMYDSFRGYRYVLAITAYPNRTDFLEDPFLYGSNDGINWHLFADMPQPLAVAPNEWSYNSDVWMCQDPRTGELYICYREYFIPDAAAVGDPSRQETRLKFRSTRDGVNWSEPYTFLTMVDLAANVSPISPSILFDIKTLTWHMWAVQRPDLGRWTAKSIYGPWTYQGTFPISSASATKPNPPHHLEVKCIGDQIIALVGDRWTGDQYLARLSFEAPRTWTWAPVTALLGDGGTDLLDNRYKATFLPRIKPDGTMKCGIWWTGGSSATLSLRYAETQAFPVTGWGRARMWEHLIGVTAITGGYSATLNTPMGKAATLVDGLRVKAVLPSASTGTSVSLVINGTGYSLRRRLGGAMTAGALQPGIEYEIELRSGGLAYCLDLL